MLFCCWIWIRIQACLMVMSYRLLFLHLYSFFSNFFYFLSVWFYAVSVVIVRFVLIIRFASFHIVRLPPWKKITNDCDCNSHKQYCISSSNQFSFILSYILVSVYPPLHPSFHKVIHFSHCSLIHRSINSLLLPLIHRPKFSAITHFLLPPSNHLASHFTLPATHSFLPMDGLMSR